MPKDLSAPEQIQLRERVKELQCLFRVAALSQLTEYGIQDYLRALPDLLPAGWFYPEIAAARVEYRGQAYQTGNFQETQWMLAAPLVVGDRAVGRLELVYLEEMPPVYEGPFLAEERELLNALATHIAKTLQNKDLEERLRRAQRLEALGFLAGGVAHDFNNYLSVISMVAEQALMKEGRGEAVSGELKEILAVVERSGRLAHRLVGFTSRSNEEPEPVSINATLKECRAMLGRLLSQGVELRLDLEPELRRVKLEPTRLDQLLANLTVNAREAMPDGGVFEIQTRNLPGDKVLLSFQDSGTGMTEETLARLFEPFYSTKGHGAGLGLATVEDIIHHAGGEISVKSELGAGTCFELVLPALPDQQALPDSLALPAQATILLVDDEPALRYLCERLLASMGYRVLAAESGEEALRIAKDEQGVIDLLLSDVNLADMNGRQLSEQLGLQRPEVSTLLMSGYNLEACASGKPG